MGDAVRKSAVLGLETELDEIRNSIRGLIKMMITGLLKHHQFCEVYMSSGDYTTVYEIDLHQEDFGRLMGTKGRNINAIRTIVQAIAASHNFRVVVQIKDEGRFF